MSLPALYNWRKSTMGNTSISRKFRIKKDGVPLDLTNVDIRMQVRNKRGDLCADLSTHNNKIKKEGVNAYIIKPFRITESFGIMYYDIEFSFPDGRIETYLRGGFELQRSFTQS